MAIRVKGLGGIMRKLDGLVKVNPSRLDRVGAYVVQAITDRTLSGKDIDGRAFKGYTPSYVKQRLKHGRGSKVDLNDKGNMLAALTYKKTKKSVIVFFRSRDENLKAHGHHFGNKKKGLPQRKFFGLNRKERAKVKRILSA